MIFAGEHGITEGSTSLRKIKEEKLGRVRREWSEVQGKKGELSLKIRGMDVSVCLFH